VAEYIEGESEDCWMNQTLLNGKRGEYDRLSKKRGEAIARRHIATNPFSSIIAAVSVPIYERRIAQVVDDIKTILTNLNLFRTKIKLLRTD
jgi:alanine-alpha-ketoisovalerate/valine-pyruvate aminotransferase